jgi:hypothetical protein
MDITAKYNRNDFIDFLTNSFLPDDFQTGNENIVIDKPNSRIKTAEKLGGCPSLLKPRRFLFRTVPCHTFLLEFQSGEKFSASFLLVQMCLF